MRALCAAWLGAFAMNASGAAGTEPLRLCMAEDSEPYSAVDNGQARGFDVAMMRAVAERIGRGLELVWFEGRYDKEGNLSLDARALLAAGACDLVAGIPLYEPHLATMIAERARTPDYPGAKPLRQRPYQALVPVVGGGPYRATAMALIGRGAPSVSTLDALQGHTVAVRAGSMASLALGAWRGGILSSSMKGFNVREDLLAAVEAGDADHALVDVALWDRYRSLHPTTRLAPTGFEHPVKINIGVLARSSDAELMGAVSAAIAQEVSSLHAAQLAERQRATWIRPVEPVVRSSLTLRDFVTPGG